MELIVIVLLYGITAGIIISAVACVSWLVKWLIIFIKDCFEKSSFLGFFVSGLSIAVICCTILYLIGFCISKG